MTSTRVFHIVLSSAYSLMHFFENPTAWERYTLEQAKLIADEPDDKIYKITVTTKAERLYNDFLRSRF